MFLEHQIYIFLMKDHVELFLLYFYQINMTLVHGVCGKLIVG